MPIVASYAQQASAAVGSRRTVCRIEIDGRLPSATHGKVNLIAFLVWAKTRRERARLLAYRAAASAAATLRRRGKGESTRMTSLPGGGAGIWFAGSVPSGAPRA